MGSAQETLQHLKTLIIENEFRFEIGSVYKKMQVIPVDERWILFVAPGLGIKMQTENNIRTQL